MKQNKKLQGDNFMENNKNATLAFIVLALGLVFFVGGMVYSIWWSF